MRHRLALPLLVAFLSLTWGTASQAEIQQAGNLRVSFEADFAPHSLPRLKAAPVEVEINGKIATTDGSHPPALRWLEVSLHRNGRLSAKGLPVCAAPVLQSTSSEGALERCRGARVGRGSFRAEVALGGEPIPTRGTILAFNSRRGDKPALLLHLFTAVPARFTMVVPLVIGHRQEGQFGTVLRARVPKLGGGLGSITEIDLTIGRRYSFAGKRRSYVSAACGAPAGFPGAIFSFARGSFRFEAHREIRTTLIRDCTVR
ncbi:MAG TPA: hypothetical protein VGV69_00545 [Solirubrobacterales bacterium]|nr:hypothetical protein [Solirubrobacterales bacterium]